MLALALEEGRVQRLHVVTTAPDALADQLVAGGATLEHPVRDRVLLDRGGRLRWRQGSVIVNGAPVIVATEMSPVQRDPYVEAIVDEAAETSGGQR